MKPTLLFVFGTRPEALKFAPLIHAFRKERRFRTRVCLTGQHREMLDQVVKLFHIPVDYRLDLMRDGQSLESLSARILEKFSRLLRQIQPDLVFVQGDTTSAFLTGLCAYYARVPVAHLEAGLRTQDKFQPFPEEMNRRLLSHTADFHFAPTRTAAANLRREGLAASSIYCVGNSIVDTIRMAPRFLRRKAFPVFDKVDWTKRILFVTAHRRESFGRGLRSIFEAFRTLADRFPEVQIVYPVHLNPNVQRPAHEILGGHPRLLLIRPLDYEETFYLLKRCYLILTDSGGIQEEAPSFKKPVLVLRNVTEREEGVRAGVARLVGTETKNIVRETARLLRRPERYREMQARRNPYGDGKTSERIVSLLTGCLFPKDRNPRGPLP